MYDPVLAAIDRHLQESDPDGNAMYWESWDELWTQRAEEAALELARCNQRGGQNGS